MTKSELSKAIEYMEKLPPSKWDAALVLRFKTKVLPELRKLVETMAETDDLYEKAKEIFGVNQP